MLNILKQVYMHEIARESSKISLVVKSFENAFKLDEGEMILLPSERKLLRQKFSELKSVISALHEMQNGIAAKQVTVDYMKAYQNEVEADGKFLNALILALDKQGFEIFGWERITIGSK